jgi:hypothetical protein
MFYAALDDISVLDNRTETVRQLVCQVGIAPGNSNLDLKEVITPNNRQTELSELSKVH